MPRPALSARRALEIVNFLAAHPAESFTLSEIVQRLGINVASAHAIVAVLTEAAFLSRHPSHRTYTLGPGLVAAGNAALEHHPAIDSAWEEIRRVSDELDMELALTAPAGDDIVFVARAGRPESQNVPLHVGQRVPLVPPLGSVFVAWSSEARIEAWLTRAPASTKPAERERFRQSLVTVRDRGYSIALDAEARRGLSSTLARLADQPRNEALQEAMAHEIADLSHAPYHLDRIDTRRAYDVSMIAAPVFGSSGEAVLAITLVSPPPRLSGKQLVEYGNRLRSAGLVVTRRTRGIVPGDPPPTATEVTRRAPRRAR